MFLEFGSNVLWEFPEDLLDFRETWAETMGVVDSLILAPHLPAFLTICAETAHAHLDDVLLQVDDIEVAREEESEEEIGVGSDLIGLVVETFAQEDVSFDVASGVEW